MSGADASPAQLPRRIVSLVPSLTETLFELGVGEQVVGATKFCVHPVSGMEGVARVGGTKDPKVEAILALRPDLVLLNEEENRLEDAEALRRAGLRVEVTYPLTVAQVPPMLRRLGVMVGAPERGEALGARLEEEILRSATRRPSKPVRFLVLIWRGPWMGAAAQTFLSDLLVQAGGRNALGVSPRPYPELSAHEIAQLDPERVLLPSEPFPFQERHIKELIELAGIPRSRVVACDGELLTWHGSRTVRGLRAAHDWLTPPDASSSR